MRLSYLLEAGEEYHHAWAKPTIPPGWTRSQGSLGAPTYTHESGAMITLGPERGWGNKKWLLFLKDTPRPQYDFPPTPEGLLQAFQTFTNRPLPQKDLLLPGTKDPELEKDLGGKIAQPIHFYSSGYSSPQRQIQKKLHDTWGYDMLGRGDPREVSATEQNPFPKGIRPKGYSPSVVGTGDLNRATRYWLNTYAGTRWPALEAAIMARAATYRGTGGDVTKPRITLFTYLNNLKEPWPEGEKLAKGFFDALRLANMKGAHSYNRGVRATLEHPAVKKYATLRKISLPDPNEPMPGVKHLDLED